MSRLLLLIQKSFCHDKDVYSLSYHKCSTFPPLITLFISIVFLNFKIVEWDKQLVTHKFYVLFDFACDNPMFNNGKVTDIIKSEGFFFLTREDSQFNELSYFWTLYVWVVYIFSKGHAKIQAPRKTPLLGSKRLNLPTCSNKAYQ